MTTLHDHLLSERGPVRFEDIERSDIPAMGHCQTFPKSAVELRRQLTALALHGLATTRTDAEGKEVWQACPLAAPVDPQPALPGFDYIA